MNQHGEHIGWRYSRYNPRYSVAARIPLRNLRQGLRDFRAFAIPTLKWLLEEAIPLVGFYLDVILYLLNA